MLKLFRKIKFAKSKRDAAEQLENKKAEIKVFAELIKEILLPNQRTIGSNESIGVYQNEIEGADTPVYFYDFLKEWNNNGNFVMTGNGGIPTAPSGIISISGDSGDTTPPAPTTVSLGISEDLEKIEPKVIIKPIDVFHELEKLPNAVSLENLDEKIATFRMRQKFIRYNDYAKKEVIDMVVRLENRKKYDEFKGFFDKYDYTTTEKINALISKYDLVLKSSDLFIPTFPTEAISIMNEYEENVIKLCNKKPVFYVIAENSKFKKEFDRNDPILLAQSPFGIYWNILGAWDKEILLLEEL